MDNVGVVLLSLMAILILVFVIAVLYNKYNDLRKENDILRADFYEKCDELATTNAECEETLRKSILRSYEVSEAWRIFHLCNKQRRGYRKLAVILNTAENEALKGDIAFIKNKENKNKFAVLSNERLKYLLDIERRYQYLDAKMKLEETPETRDSFERANFEKYLEEFEANKKRLQKIVNDYEKHELEVKNEKR